jgi:DNA polymerase-1
MSTTKREHALRAERNKALLAENAIARLEGEVTALKEQVNLEHAIRVGDAEGFGERILSLEADAGVGLSGHLYVLDATNLAYRYFHAYEYVHCGAVYGMLRALSRVRQAAPTHACAVLDGPGPTFRHRLLPSYKSGRPPRPEALARQDGLLLEAFSAHGVPALTSEGVEADDLAAALCGNALREGMEVTVVSADKDLTQLMASPGVRVINPAGWEEVAPEDVERRLGVPPRLVGDLLALAGDPGDGVPGVPGIGPKTAAALLTRAGSLEALRDSAHLVRGKRGEALRKSMADGSLELSRVLVGLDSDASVPGMGELRLPPPDHRAVRALCLRLGFRDLAPPDWPEGF